MTRKYARSKEPMAVATLRECVRYEPATGKLFWLARPRHHFADNAAWRTQHTRDAGKEVIRLGSDGYIWLRVVVGDLLYSMAGHRAAWALHYGKWPAEFLDHRDQVRSNNRIENLREATKRDNQRNRGVSASNKGGLKFVRPGRWGKGFEATAVVEGKSLYMGTFATPEEAHAAAVAHLRPIYGEFLNDGKTERGPK